MRPERMDPPGCPHHRPHGSRPSTATCPSPSSPPPSTSRRPALPICSAARPALPPARYLHTPADGAGPRPARADLPHASRRSWPTSASTTPAISAATSAATTASRRPASARGGWARRIADECGRIGGRRADWTSGTCDADRDRYQPGRGRISGLVHVPRSTLSNPLEGVPVSTASSVSLLPASIACVGVSQIHPAAQDRLKSMPGYARYHELAPQIPGALKSGAVTAVWSADGASFEYTRDGKRYRYDVATRQATRAWRRPGGRGPRRPWRARTGRARARPSGTAPPTRPMARFAPSSTKRTATSIWSIRRQDRDRPHHRRQPRAPDQVRIGQLGLRRGARSDHRDVVVARQPQARVLPLRRKPGPRLLPAARSDQAPERHRHRGLSQGRRRQSRSSIC